MYSFALYSFALYSFVWCLNVDLLDHVVIQTLKVYLDLKLMTIICAGIVVLVYQIVQQIVSQYLSMMIRLVD